MLRKRLMALIVLTGILQACSGSGDKDKPNNTDTAKKRGKFHSKNN